MNNISPLTGLPFPPAVIMNALPLPMSYEQFRSDHPTELIVEPEKTIEQHDLSWPQYEFVTTKAKFPAMIAGYGAGKTEAGVIRALYLKLKYY